jgi:hypothetical protein
MDKYQEALKLAKKEYENADGILREILERIFPGLLQETENERLRKTTISFLEEFKKKGYENAVECIEWLEKQKPIFEDSEQRDPWEYIEKFKSLYGHYPSDADEIGVIVSEMIKKANSTMSEKDEIDKGFTKMMLKEENKKMISAIYQVILDSQNENGWNCVYCGDREISYESIKNWLESLKKSDIWKPSEEQLLSLKFIIKNYPDYVYNADLELLYEDLKKL